MGTFGAIRARRDFVSPSYSLFSTLSTSLILRLVPFFSIGALGRNRIVWICWFQSLHSQLLYYCLGPLQTHTCVPLTSNLSHGMPWSSNINSTGMPWKKAKWRSYLLSRANNHNRQYHLKFNLLFTIISVIAQRYCFILYLKAKLN